MISFDVLEARWRDLPPPPRDVGRVRLIVLRKGGGVHETPSRAEVDVERGVIGDRWVIGDGDFCQVTLMEARVAELVADGNVPLHMPGDNLLVDFDLSELSLPPGTRLRAGTAGLEVQAEPHTGCKLFSQRFGAEALRWVNWKQHRERRLRGINCRVIATGSVSVGDSMEVVRISGT